MRPRIGAVEHNLDRARVLAEEAAAAGAELIVLPEFFSTGMAYDPALDEAALPFDGAATTLLRTLAADHGALVGGSFICTTESGARRNRFVLVGPDGVLGYHDKDLPTMWENCYYEPGTDDGLIEAGGLTFGVAMCWELMRAQTARRLRGRVDILIGGSAWWSVPDWRPAPLWHRLARRNATNAARAPAAMAHLLGVPYVHAALCGGVRCDMPLLPLRYRGRYVGGAVISDAHGAALARRGAESGEGVVLAMIPERRRAPAPKVPSGFWLHRRGTVASAAWTLHGRHGRRYRRASSARSTSASVL